MILSILLFVILILCYAAIVILATVGLLGGVLVLIPSAALETLIWLLVVGVLYSVSYLIGFPFKVTGKFIEWMKQTSKKQ